MGTHETALTELYKSFELDDYLPYINFDGLWDLIAPDVFDAHAIHLVITNSDQLLKEYPEDRQALFKLFDDAQDAWDKFQGKTGTFTVDFK